MPLMPARWRVLAAAAAVLASTGTGLVAAPAAASGAAFHAVGTGMIGPEGRVTASPAASGCKDVLFLGARGSGEKGPGTPGWSYGLHDPDGLGSTVESAYKGLKQKIGGYRSIEVTSVGYQADSVWTLVKNHDKYFAGLSAGVIWALNYLKAQARACPDQQIVLAGFSQGAMVMHRVLRQLEGTAAGDQILPRLADAILVGDGDQVPHDNQVRFGSAASGARGVGNAFPKISGWSKVKFPPAVGSRVLSVCNAHDIVCGWTDSNIVKCLEFGIVCPILAKTMVKVHESYPGSKPLAAAANRAALDVRAVPLPTPRNVTLTAAVGTAFGHQLQADIGPGRALQWGLVPPEVMPAGLTLNSGGLISGTPTADGKSTTLIRVRSVQGGWHSLWVPASVTLDVRPASVWNEVPGPLPPGVSSTEPSYSSVACADPGTCVVAGYYFVGQTETAGLLLTGSGTAWTAMAAPLPANAWGGPGVSLSSVACAGPSGCVAVGSYLDSSDANQGLLLTGAGTAWTGVEAPLPGGAMDAALSAVACPATDRCVAVGEYGDASGAEHVLAETGFGASWTPATITLPANVADTLAIQSIACPATTMCVAAGDYSDSSGNDDGLLLTMSGTSWTATTAPLPAGAQAESYTQPVTALACPSTSACVAVGYYRDQYGNTQGLVLVKQGTIWKAQKAPVPANARTNPSAEPVSVSCPSASACAIAGTYTDQSGERQGLLLSLSGSSLTPKEAPVPANAERSGYGGIAWLSSVSCPSATRCVAAGGYVDIAGNAQGLLLTESGSQWFPAEAPLPQGTSDMVGYGPTAVACLSATQCEAIGYYAQSTPDPNQFDSLLVSGPG